MSVEALHKKQETSGLVLELKRHKQKLKLADYLLSLGFVESLVLSCAYYRRGCRACVADAMAPETEKRF